MFPLFVIGPHGRLNDLATQSALHPAIITLYPAQLYTALKPCTRSVPTFRTALAAR
jgi:hypothetical protein